MIKRRKYDRLRYQLGGAFLFSAIIPYLIRLMTVQSAAQMLPITQALYGSILAIVLGTFLYRSVTTYPGVEKSSYVLPAFTIAYATLLLVFIMTRLDYNRTMLVSGYTISIAWFLVLHSRQNRHSIIRIGVLPFGEKARMEQIPGVDWITLTDSDTPVAGLDAVAADLRTDLPSAWDRRLADFALSGLPVYHTKHLIESLTGRVELEHLSENSFGSLAPVSAFMTIKAVIDWVIAILAGVVLAPAFLVIAIMVRAGSPGPALFRQRRIGYKGEVFTVYKFRTMTAAREVDCARDDAMTKDHDARITPFGHFLRRSRIDELPQIINILRGEMSWIGPRPEAEILSRWYEAEIPFYRYRHIVKPGITGWAQVSQGHVTDLDDIQSKLHYDFYYIKHYSMWIDLLIVVRTVRTMLTGFGSR
jgi:exopolysaccharide biosynthesis polyprenyl glycosylphosphotransferase